MGNDLISRNALLEHMKNWAFQECPIRIDEPESDVYRTIKEAINLVKEHPTAYDTDTVIDAVRHDLYSIGLNESQTEIIVDEGGKEMSEFLFRGKHIHLRPENEHLDGRWIYGYLADKNYINSPELEGELLVDPETICQCTNVPDKNRKKIFKGDIVKRQLFEGYIIGEVVRVDIGFCGFYLKCGNKFYPMGKNEDTGISDCDEVIGNIFDNPELMEVEK